MQNRQGFKPSHLTITTTYVQQKTTMNTTNHGDDTNEQKATIQWKSTESTQTNRSKGSTNVVVVVVLNIRT